MIKPLLTEPSDGKVIALDHSTGTQVSLHVQVKA